MPARPALILAALLVSSCGATHEDPVRPRAAAVTAAPTPLPPPAVASEIGYSFITVDTERGAFSVHLIKERLIDVSVKTLTASTVICRSDCPAKPLARYVEETGAYAGINGTYFCPPDYPACAGKVNTYDYAVFDSTSPQWVNLVALSGQNALMTFSGSTAVAYRRASAYTNGPAWRRPITAGISMYPLLVEDGAIVDSERQQSDAQRQRGARGAIGVDGTHVFLAITLGATLTETAIVLKALGVQDALNLDGGGSTAMFLGGAYKVGPGRQLPNAIVLTKP